MNKMDQETKEFKENVDAWIKQIRQEVSEVKYNSPITGENTDNIQHNYELIHELKDEIERLKQEINALKIIQLVSMKKNVQ